jgi:hypothetical protein
MSETEKPKGRSNPGTESAPNPASLFISWKSKNEKFSYYDKEEKKDVLLKMPFSFIPLFVCTCVRGYNHKKGKTYISNEIENLQTDVLTVTSYNTKTKDKKIEHKGLYADIKDDFDSNVKFTVSLYAAIKGDDKKLKLVNLQLNGAGLHHWISFTKKHNIWKEAVKVKSFTEEVNGDVEFKAPVYEPMPLSPEMDEEAGELQEVIKAHLKEYFKRTQSVVDADQDNGLNDKKAAKSDKPAAKANPKKKAALVEEEEEEESNDLHTGSEEDFDDEPAF